MLFTELLGLFFKIFRDLFFRKIDAQFCDWDVMRIPEGYKLAQEKSDLTCQRFVSGGFYVMMKSGFLYI